MKNALVKSLGKFKRLLGCSLFVLLSSVAAAQDIVLGQSVPLTGNNADIGRDMRDGALAVFAQVNSSNLLRGHKIVLVTLDNANSRPRALENTQQLLNTHKVAALFGYNSATVSLDALPLLTANHMMLFAPFTGSPSVRDHPNVYTVRASYADEVAKIVAQQKIMGATKVAVLYYDDEAGRSNLEAAQSVFEGNNKPKPVPVKRNTKLEPAVFDALLKDPPHYVLATTQYSAVGDLLNAAASKGVVVPVAALSFVNPDELMDSYGAIARGTIVSQVMPSPRGANLINNDMVKDCAAMLKTYNGATLNYTSLESCVAAKSMVKIIQKTGVARATRAGLLEAMTGAGRVDLDGFILNYNKGEHHGSHYVDLTIVSRGNTFAR